MNGQTHLSADMKYLIFLQLPVKTLAKLGWMNIYQILGEKTFHSRFVPQFMDDVEFYFYTNRYDFVVRLKSHPMVDNEELDAPRMRVIAKQQYRYYFHNDERLLRLVTIKHDFVQGIYNYNMIHKYEWLGCDFNTYWSLASFLKGETNIQCHIE